MKKTNIKNKFLFLMVLVNIPISGILWLAAPHYGAMASVMVLMAIAFSYQFTENWGDIVVRSLAFFLKNSHNITTFLSSTVLFYYIAVLKKLPPYGHERIISLWIASLVVTSSIELKKRLPKKIAE